MGSRDKFYGIVTQSHGYDDIGPAQTGGTINSVAKYGSTGKWAKYAAVTASAPHGLTRGQPINIIGTTDYDGPTRVVAIVSSTVFVIKRGFTVTKTGTWDMRAADGNWDAFMPMGSDWNAIDLAFVYWKPDVQGGLDGFTSFTKDVVYQVPGGLKTLTTATASTAATAAHAIRLIRSASSRPGGLRNPVAAQVISYNPTGGTAGSVVDIVGQNFAQAADNNVVYFGAKSVPVVSADQEGCILTVVLPTGVVSAPVNVKSHGLAGATGPTFNIN